MRSALIVSVVLLSRLAASPVPVGTTKSAPAGKTKELHAYSLTYAQQLLSVATQVSASYIRPVERNELLLAGLVGLHEAARQPVPPGLPADLKRLTSDEAMIQFLSDTRERLGNGEGLKDREALLASCRALLKSLDPYSDVVTEQDRRNQVWGDQPAGLGLELVDNVGVGPLRIARVLPGTPAQRAGLRPGDEILQLNHEPVRGKSSTAVAGLLSPRSGQQARIGFDTELRDSLPTPAAVPPVKLTVRRPGSPPRPVKLEHQESKPEAVLGVQRAEDNSWLYFADREHRIAHVRIEALHRGVALELSELLGRLESEGLKGLILDLRWSTGGFLDEAIGVAGLFLGDCIIVKVRNRGQEEIKYHNIAPRRFEKVPLVVLINGQTSGGSELIVAALQDHGRAAIAGQRSLGKATVQTALYVDIPGTSLKLTSGEFIRPSRKTLHRKPDSGPRDDWGVRPDPGLEFPLSPQMARELKQGWELQTLRPGSDNQILPLDDPKNDPQREAALQYLRAKRDAHKK